MGSVSRHTLSGHTGGTGGACVSGRGRARPSQAYRHAKAHQLSLQPERAPATEDHSPCTCVDFRRQALERAYSHHEAAPLNLAALDAPHAPMLADRMALGSLGVLQVQVGGKPEPPKQRHERHDDFYANVGTAIRTLREDVPVLFVRDMDYDIYREDVVFRDPRNCFRGMKNYQTIFWSLRFHGNLFFKSLYVEVKRIWQKTDDTICLRWTVHGFPRLPWDQEGTFDGVSTYKLDSHGKIYEHKVDNVIMGDPPMQRLPMLVTLNLSPPARQLYPTPWQFGEPVPQGAQRLQLPTDAGSA